MIKKMMNVIKKRMKIMKLKMIKTMMKINKMKML